MKTKEEKINKRQNNYKKVIGNDKNKINIQNSDYQIEFILLNETKKLKINLVITDKNNTKEFYSKFLTLNELISLNNYFLKYKDYSEAFEYLKNNYTKIDKTKITHLNNKQVNIIIFFSVEENNNIYEESIELTMNKNIKSKNMNSNILNIINNLKTSLENFDSSIKELKAVVDKDKIEKDKKINTLENNINIKLSKIKDEINSNLIKINKQTNINIKDKIKEGNIKLENIDIIIEAKINELFDNKMLILDEKLQILNNKVINLERGQNKLYEKNRNEESFIKDSSFNFGDSIIYDKYDKKFQNMNNNLNNKIKKLANKLNINIKDLELENTENSNNNNNNNIILDEKTNDVTNNDMKDFNIKLMNEVSNKMKVMNKELETKIKNTIENKSNELINIKMQEIKPELYSMINKINERGKEDFKDLNNKINGLKNEVIKILDTKTNTMDTKIKIIENKSNKLSKDNQTYLEKLNYYDIKIKNIDNKIKQLDNKIDINTNNNLNNSSIIPNTSNLLNDNTLNLKEGIDSNNKKNTSFNLSSNSKREKNIDIDSNIFKKEEKSENFFLFSKIKEFNPYNRMIKYTLVYRATRDGNSAKNFHSKCDFIGPNLTLIKTKKNFIFGGFTYKGWKHLFKDIKKEEHEFGTELKDEKAFTFSVNEQKIYKNGKINENAIYCNNNYGPVFKNNFFKIYDECLKNGGMCGKIEESNFEGQEKEYEFNGGEEKFEIEEMEIFQMAFK